MIGSYFLYKYVSVSKIWELHYCLIPFAFILFCIEFVIPLRFLRTVLKFLGKHSMNIFMVHTFIRYNYLADYIYSQKHFAVVVLVLTALSLLVSVVLEWLKRISRYQILIDHLLQNVA